MTGRLDRSPTEVKGRAGPGLCRVEARGFSHRHRANRLLSTAAGRLQTSAFGPVRRRSSEDVHRHNHATSATHVGLTFLRHFGNHCCVSEQQLISPLSGSWWRRRFRLHAGRKRPGASSGWRRLLSREARSVFERTPRSARMMPRSAWLWTGSTRCPTSCAMTRPSTRLKSSLCRSAMLAILWVKMYACPSRAARPSTLSATAFRPDLPHRHVAGEQITRTCSPGASAGRSQWPRRCGHRPSRRSASPRPRPATDPRQRCGHGPRHGG